MAGPKAPQPPDQPAASPAKLSPGMATLLRVGDRHPKTEPPPEPTEPTTPAHRSRKQLRFSLWLADLLLLGLAARLVFKSGGTFGWLEITLCTIAVLTGAWLACLALWLD